jgi:hypothetical protein
MAELQKHPYHSSKFLLLILVEKPGTGIFLMKESAKLHRPQKERERRSWRSDSGHPVKPATMKKRNGAQNKRQNLGEGQFAEVPPTKPGDTSMKSGMK